MIDGKIFNPQVWNTLWRTRREELHRAGVPDCASLWEDPEQAQRYLESTQKEPQGGRISQMLEDLRIVQKDWRVLDIGSGPGTLAIPLATRAKEVIAIEPSYGMRKVLEDQIQKKEIKNVSILPYRWEETPLESLGSKFDLVLCAFSLGMEDLLQAVEAMNRVSRGWVFLYWFVGESSWQRTKRELWPLLHGKTLPDPLAVDLVYNLLFSMGIPVEVKRYRYSQELRFKNERDVVFYFRRGFLLNTLEKEKEFLALFAPRLIPKGTHYVCREEAEFAAYSWKNI